ncbi:MAG: primosomal protein N' [Deltaproteobacteria bacterium]|nr:primosomal protein N' [Deltaproteobacteria bacterium]
MNDQGFAEVAVSLPLWKTFTYRVPKGLEGQVELGKRVLIPFHRRKVTGYVIDFPTPLPDSLDPDKVREIIDVLDEIPLFDENMLGLFRWISRYYFYPLGEVIKTGLPPGLTVESCRILEITPRGEAHLAQLQPGGGDRLLLEACRERKELNLPLLSRRLKIRNIHSRIFALKKNGFLTEQVRLKKERTRAKQEAVFAFQEEDKQVKRPGPTPKESEILEFIKSRTRVSRSDVTRRFSRVAPYLRRLVEKGWLSVDFEERYREPFLNEGFGTEKEPELTEDQQVALAEIERSIEAGGYHPYLLHGITGSGKTEVYLRAIKQVMKRGREAIVLVPEISLTPQLISRFKTRFGRVIAVLHSGLSPAERYDQWRRIVRHEVRIVIGARSAIFAPFKKPGIIIVDEEHETSFKQEEKLKYNARDLAVVRAKMDKAVLVLGSATPSMESFFNTLQIGKFQYLRLPRRIESRVLPAVEIVDMRAERDRGRRSVFSQSLKEALLANADRGQQSLLFLNRRGFANFILCTDCGWTFHCPNCSVTLTFHAPGRLLQCHHCGHTAPVPLRCPHCESYNLHPLGIGTQRVEDEIRKLMPSARVARMDRDTTARKGAHWTIVRAMERRKIDVLIGTQMIVKGHDFPSITLVGVICADTILNFPDFRATERTFQLLTQAAGRAGRGDQAGRVIIQTYNPDHYSIQRAKEHDFLGFYQEEIAYREELGYPPFSRLVNLRISGNREDRTEAFAKRLAIVGAETKRRKGVYRDHIELLGPCAAPLARVKGRYRWQLLAKSSRPESLHRFLAEVLARMEKETPGIRLEVDVDPINLM